MLISEPSPIAVARLPKDRSTNIGEMGHRTATDEPHALADVAPRVSVVIPAKNEEHNIGWVLGRLPANVYEVVIVDGRSADDTVGEALRTCPGCCVITQQSNGKGAALALGLAAVTGDIAVIIDADGSMDPAEIFGLVGALLSGADVVKGSRAAAGGGSRDLSTLRRLGNRGLTSIANRIYGQSWRELCYGYAAFWTDVLPLLDVATLTTNQRAAHSFSHQGGIEYGHGFEIEALLFCRAARARLRVAEVPSFEHQRRSGDSNLATFKDGWRVLTAVWRERRFRPAARTGGARSRRYPVRPHLHSIDQTLDHVMPGAAQ